MTCREPGVLASGNSVGRENWSSYGLPVVPGFQSRHRLPWMLLSHFAQSIARVLPQNSGGRPTMSNKKGRNQPEVRSHKLCRCMNSGQQKRARRGSRGTTAPQRGCGLSTPSLEDHGARPNRNGIEGPNRRKRLEGVSLGHVVRHGKDMNRWNGHPRPPEPTRKEG